MKKLRICYTKHFYWQRCFRTVCIEQQQSLVFIVLPSHITYIGIWVTATPQ